MVKVKLYIVKMNQTKLNGFTMFELLVAMAIIGILSALAVPQFLPMISKAKANEAKLQLRHVLMLQKNHFYVNSKYSNSLAEIGFEQSKLVTEDGNANYKIEISNATINNFTAKATAVADFDGDGIFNVWQITGDEKLTEVTPD